MMSGREDSAPNVVVAEDNVEYATGALLKASADAGVARLMVPFTVPRLMAMVWAARPPASGSLTARMAR